MIDFKKIIAKTERTGIDVINLAKRVRDRSNTPLNKIILGIYGLTPLGIDDADYISEELNLSNREYEEIFFAE